MFYYWVLIDPIDQLSQLNRHIFLFGSQRSNHWRTLLLKWPLRLSGQTDVVPALSVSVCVCRLKWKGEGHRVSTWAGSSCRNLSSMRKERKDRRSGRKWGNPMIRRVRTRPFTHGFQNWSKLQINLLVCVHVFFRGSGGGVRLPHPLRAAAGAERQEAGGIWGAVQIQWVFVDLCLCCFQDLYLLVVLQVSHNIYFTETKTQRLRVLKTNCTWSLTSHWEVVWSSAPVLSVHKSRHIICFVILMTVLQLNYNTIHHSHEQLYLVILFLYFTSSWQICSCVNPHPITPLYNWDKNKLPLS